MKVAIYLVVVAGLLFVAAAAASIGTRVPNGRGMTLGDWVGVACVGFLILAGARIVYVTLRRRSA